MQSLNKTEVEKFMEEQGKPMSPNFKKVNLNRWILWRQGKVQDKEFEIDAKE